MKCQHCKQREATVKWVGEGGTIAFVHGCYENWCEVCALEAQLAHAKERAAEIPEMERQLAELKAQVPNAGADAPATKTP